MAVLGLLKKDHEKVSNLLEKMSKTTERAMQRRVNLFNQLEKEFFIHTRFEEKIFYPILKERSPSKMLIFEAYEEHQSVKYLLRSMRGLEVDKEKWTAKLAVLKRQIVSHIQEEENELFPMAEKLLPPEELRQLAKELKKYKERWSHRG